MLRSVSNVARSKIYANAINCFRYLPVIIKPDIKKYQIIYTKLHLRAGTINVERLYMKLRQVFIST